MNLLRNQENSEEYNEQGDKRAESLWGMVPEVLTIQAEEESKEGEHGRTARINIVCRKFEWRSTE